MSWKEKKFLKHDMLQWSLKIYICIENTGCAGMKGDWKTGHENMWKPAGWKNNQCVQEEEPHLGWFSLIIKQY